MRLVALMFGFLIGGCVTSSERGDFAPSASAPQIMSPGALTTEAARPNAPGAEQGRCPPGDDAASGYPGHPQAEAGVLTTVPASLGVPPDTRWYTRTGCEPAH